MRSTCLALAFTVVSGATLFGCEDPVPLIPRGAWAVDFRSLSNACKIETHTANVGEVASEGTLDLKADGSDTAEVECEVKASGGGYAVEGEVSYKGQYLQISVAELKKDATFEAPANGRVDFKTGQTAEIYQGDCIVYFVNDQLVDKGKVWGSFQCETVTGPQDSECSVQQGYFAFENCVGSSTGEEEEE